MVMANLAPDLSSRDLEVLHLFGSWHITDEEIAKQLRLTPSGAHSRVCNLMKKLDIHDRALLVRYAVFNRFGKQEVAI